MNNTNPITIKYLLNYENFSEMTKEVNKLPFRRNYLRSIIYLILLCSFALILILTSSGDLIQVGIPGLVIIGELIGCIFLLVKFLLLKRKIQEEFEKNKFKNLEYKISIDNETYRQEADNVSSLEKKLSYFDEFYKTEKGFFIKSNNCFYWIPIKGFSSSEDIILLQGFLKDTGIPFVDVGIKKGK